MKARLTNILVNAQKGGVLGGHLSSPGECLSGCDQNTTGNPIPMGCTGGSRNPQVGMQVGTSTLAMNVAELHPCIQNAGVQRGTGFAKMPGERRIQEGEHSS